ncbi:putative clathrin assembly protein, partial [Tanacetum coccineum]
PLRNYITIRNITRERYNLCESMADVILDGAWNLPRAWFDVYLVLNQTSTPVLAPNKEDQVVWRTSKDGAAQAVYYPIQEYSKREKDYGSLEHSKWVDVASWNIWNCLGFLRLKLRKASDPIIYVQRTRELDTPELFGQLSALQQFLYSVLATSSAHNFVIQLTFIMVASESVKVYKAISEGTQNSVDKFFEMKQYDAAIAMDIYKRAVMQMCNSIDTGRGNEFRLSKFDDSLAAVPSAELAKEAIIFPICRQR